MKGKEDDLDRPLNHLNENTRRPSNYFMNNWYVYLLKKIKKDRAIMMTKRERSFFGEGKKGRNAESPDVAERTKDSFTAMS